MNPYKGSPCKGCGAAVQLSTLVVKAKKTAKKWGCKDLKTDDLPVVVYVLACNQCGRELWTVQSVHGQTLARGEAEMEPETYSLKLDFDTAMRVKEMMLSAIADEEEAETSSGAISIDIEAWRKSQTIVCDQLKSQGI